MPPRGLRSLMRAFRANTGLAAIKTSSRASSSSGYSPHSGPYFGHVQRLSDGKEPKKIAFIQCVGSRDTSCGNNLVLCRMLHVCNERGSWGRNTHGNWSRPSSLWTYGHRERTSTVSSTGQRKSTASGTSAPFPPASRNSSRAKTSLLPTSWRTEGRWRKNSTWWCSPSGLHRRRTRRSSRRAWVLTSTNTGSAEPHWRTPVQTSRPGVFVCGAFGGPRTYRRR